MSPQPSFSAHYWLAKEGAEEAEEKTEASPQLMESDLQQKAFLTWEPLVNHCAAILQSQRCVCLPSASFERPLSNQPPHRHLWDCFEHAQNLKWHPWHCVDIPCATFEWPRWPFSIHWASSGDLVSFKVTLGRHKGRRLCVKGILVLFTHSVCE